MPEGYKRQFSIEKKELFVAALILTFDTQIIFRDVGIPVVCLVDLTIKLISN